MEPHTDQRGAESCLMNVVNELRTFPKRTQSLGEELANSVSHGIGLVGALIGAPILLLTALDTGDGGFFIGTIVFTAAMLLLYLGSMLYHAWPQTRGKSILQVLDHSAIFLLIAGTYTPFTLGPLRGPWGSTMLGSIWALAIFGVIVKATRGTSRHPKLAMSLYLGLGWSALIVIRPLASAVPPSAVLWLLAGGIAYTIGVLFFVNERLRYGHFVWHLRARWNELPLSRPARLHGLTRTALVQSFRTLQAATLCSPGN